MEAHTGHFHPRNLSRLLSTQRPPKTGSQSICKDPLPEGGPRMYCLPRLIVNTVLEDSSMMGFGAQNGTLLPHSFPAESGLTCTQSQRQILSSSNELI